jgi:hypothetical protein
MNRLVFVASALVAGLLTLGTGANAAWTRNHISACRVTPSGGVTFDGHQFWNNNSFNGPLVCPYVDDSSFLKQDVVTLNFHGYDGSPISNVFANACIQYWNFTGGSCAGQVGSGGGFTGNYTISLGSPSVWTSGNAGHFGYVYVLLPPGVLSSSVSGFFTGT